MKAYTDVNQSKKLAKILPIESADMYYFRQIDNDYIPPDVESIRPIPLFKDGKEDFNYDIPCWSPAALLDVLPKLGAEEPIIQKLYYACNPTERYICQYSFVNMTGEYDNPVDACYEMILKLKERSLI